jgi:hypothetical protein
MMEEPFRYSGESVDEYAEQRATLSPWTPVPDSVARKIFDRVDTQETDVRKNAFRKVCIYCIEVFQKSNNIFVSPCRSMSNWDQATAE